MASDDDGLEFLQGVTNKAMKFMKHATIEVGPSPDDLWAFRVTVHPFRSEKEAREGVVKMKRYLNTMGFTFPTEETP